MKYCTDIISKLSGYSIIIFFGLLPFFSSTLYAEKPGSPHSNQHTWNLRNVDIHSIIEEMATETNKNFILSPDVKGKVTFISSYPLTPDELYQAFIALLKISGFDAITDGPIVKIVPDNNIREEGTPFYNPLQKSTDQMAVTVVRVKYVSSTELVKVLKQLVFHYGYMEAYSPTNDIIIADFANNIFRLQTLIKTLDQPAATEVNVIHLTYTHSTDLVKIISSLLKQHDSNLKSLSLAADARSNAILAYGGTPEQILQLRRLIAQLDIPESRSTIATEVISLKYLRAEKVAVILSSLIDNYKHQQSTLEQGSADNMSSRGLSPFTANHAATTPASELPDYTHPNITSGAAIQNNGATMADNSRTAVDFSNMTKKIPRSGSVSPFVQWEESTNSVILTAPADLILKLKNVIKKLDTKRPQVLIEAIIAEVDVNLANELGVELNTGGKVQLLTRFSSTLPLSGIGSDNNIAISNPPTLDMPGQGLSGAIFAGSNLRILLRALEQDTRSNILSTPNIVTLDNEPAQIKVGERISFSIGQIQNNPTGGNPFNYFNQQDIGLILTINPQITSDGSIKLIIEQELSNILPGAVSAGNNPNLSERFIHTTVMAKDGDLLVLGGLIQDEWQDTVSKVPVLGDIPFVGFLFRSHEKQLTRQNLMIFLKPTILYNDTRSTEVINAKYNNVQRQQRVTSETVGMTDNWISSPLLPDVKRQNTFIPPPFEMRIN